jgi:hypothetical protein
MTRKLLIDTAVGDERIIRYPDGSERLLSQISIGMLGMCTLLSCSVWIVTLFWIF